ncbi:hypothetical protein LC612_30650, partial [Nostoc sp. CHAB 5834]|nr:hypothetical protein [Nostoc sp. CHAB 5834]
KNRFFPMTQATVVRPTLEILEASYVCIYPTSQALRTADAMRAELGTEEAASFLTDHVSTLFHQVTGLALPQAMHVVRGDEFERTFVLTALSVEAQGSQWLVNLWGHGLNKNGVVQSTYCCQLSLNSEAIRMAYRDGLGSWHPVVC